MMYLSGVGLPRLSWKRPLNGCSINKHKQQFFASSTSQSVRSSIYVCTTTLPVVANKLHHMNCHANVFIENALAQGLYLVQGN